MVKCYRTNRAFVAFVLDIGMLSSFQWEKKALNTHVCGLNATVLYPVAMV